MTDWLSQHLNDAYLKLDREFLDANPVEPRAHVLPEITKLTAHLQVSCCALTDSTGVNHCEHPPPVVKPLPWTWRARERWWDLRERMARALAGHRWPDEEES